MRAVCDVAWMLVEYRLNLLFQLPVFLRLLMAVVQLGVGNADRTGKRGLRRC